MRLLAPVIAVLLMVATGLVLRQLPGQGAEAAAAVVTTRSTPAEVGAMVGTIDAVSPAVVADPSPRPAARPDLPAGPDSEPTDGDGEIAAGSCFDGAAATSADIVPIACDAAHGNELYVAVSSPAIPGEAYPGRDILVQRIEEVCRGDAFAGFVGLPWADSRFLTASIVPSPDTWAEGDRTLGCFLYDLQGSRNRTARDSQL